VEVLEGWAPPMGEIEREALEDNPGWVDQFRLSCQIRVQEDMSVRVVNRSHKKGIPPGPRPAD
jgi:ferredoxin